MAEIVSGAKFGLFEGKGRLHSFSCASLAELLEFGDKAIMSLPERK